MNPAAPSPGQAGRLARSVAVGLLAYWGLFALVSPVLTIDSQMYNLARIELAFRDGLFDNAFFTSIFHIIFPWSFDAVHLPFLLLGWGHALPSFLCLAATCHVVLTMARARFGPDAAWAAVLGLLALPCVVYQATATKNDLALLAAGTVWVYARWRRRHERSAWHLLWMVLAIGLLAGAKTTGVIPAAALSLWTLWELRGDGVLWLRTAAGLMVALLLWGSVETYVESARQYGHPLGPEPLLRRLSNRDGPRGAAANFVRHVAGGIYVGPTDFSPDQRVVASLSAATRAVLDRFGLTDAGTDPRFPDERLFLHQSGLEELSGYGPLGTAALLVMLAAGLWWRRSAVWWRLAMAGLLGLLLASTTVAYTPWTNRYLLPWYALGTIATACLLWETAARGSGLLRWCFILIAAASAVAAPFWSFNRGPRDLLDSFLARERLETSAYPVVGLVRDRLRRLRADSPDRRIYVMTHDESVVLPLLTDPGLGVLLVTPAGFDDLQRQQRLAAGDFLVFETPVASAMFTLVETVTAPDVFSFSDTRSQYIYRFTPPSATDRP